MTDLAYDGQCAFALSLGPAEKAPAGRSDCTLVRDGRTYAFAGAVPRALFRMVSGSAARADRHWAERAEA